MKALCLSLVLSIVFVSVAFAGNWGGYNDKRIYKDEWGNKYKHYDNLWKDTDKDGVINFHDYNDRNPYIQNSYQRKSNNFYTPQRNFPKSRQRSYSR